MHMHISNHIIEHYAQRVDTNIKIGIAEIETGHRAFARHAYFRTLLGSLSNGWWFFESKLRQRRPRARPAGGIQGRQRARNVGLVVGRRRAVRGGVWLSGGRSGGPFLPVGLRQRDSF